MQKECVEFMQEISHLTMKNGHAILDIVADPLQRNVNEEGS
jgi:hypothetical protein